MQEMMCPRGNQLHPMPCAELEWFHARASQTELSSFHSTHHCSLPHCTPRNRDYIGQRKQEYFRFCCSKASTFAHHWKWWWGVGKTSSNTNDCCLLATQTWTALVVFRANNSVFTVLSFPNAAQVSLLTRVTTICCRRKYWTQEEWKKCTFQSIATVKMELPSNWSERVSGHKRAILSQTPCLKSFRKLEGQGQYSCFSNLHLKKKQQRKLNSYLLAYIILNLKSKLVTYKTGKK